MLVGCHLNRSTGALLISGSSYSTDTHTLLQIFCEWYKLTVGVSHRWQQTRAAQQQLARSTVQQSEPALARLALQSLGTHEPMSLSVEADQIVPSDEDVSQASMVAVIWLLSGLSPLSLNATVIEGEGVLCKKHDDIRLV